MVVASTVWTYKMTPQKFLWQPQEQLVSESICQLLVVSERIGVAQEDVTTAC